MKTVSVLLAVLQINERKIAGSYQTFKNVFFLLQTWDGNSVCENPCSLIPTPDKEEGEPASPSSTCGPQSFMLSRASPLPMLK